jgi:hypothetical protein
MARRFLLEIRCTQARAAGLTVSDLVRGALERELERLEREREAQEAAPATALEKLEQTLAELH